MTDLFDYAEEQQPQSGPENTVFSVSQLSQALLRTVEDSFGRVAVEGEIGSFRPAASGHMYFNLKDEKSVLKAIIWRSAASRLKTKPQEGLRVVAYGRITTYPARSEYQIIIDRMEPAGLGALMQMLEERKRKLTEEGLFNVENKKPIPYLPERIGIVTSPTGAVIDDMLNRIGARCPRPVSLWPVMVQGNDAAEQITAAIKGFNNLPENKKPSVIIVARGGGSFEDLMPFNEENVVRAVAESEIPVISGVGHEPDVTLIDFVADVRASTPTAAAELVVPVRADILYTLENNMHRLGQAIKQGLRHKQQTLYIIQKSLPVPSSQLTQAKLWLDDRSERINMAMQNMHYRLKEKLGSQAKLLETLAPMAPLKRGYIYVTDDMGEIIRSAKTSAKQTKLHFHDGEREALLQ